MRFQNWSGSVRFTPGEVARPADEAELVRLVRLAAERRRTVRAAGAGHSSTPLLETDQILVSLEKMRGLVAHDAAAGVAVVRGGTRLKEAGEAFHAVGLAMRNLGDVDRQALAGAIATGTHGTGRELPVLSSHLVGGRLVTGTGEVVAFSQEADGDLLRAAAVSLGALGILSELRLRLVPAYGLRRTEWCTHVKLCLAHLDELIAGNRNFDFYWYPRSDEAKLRLLNEPGRGMQTIPYARLRSEREGPAHEVIPRRRDLRFDEMEYFLPRDAAPACFREVRRRIRARHRREVAWRVLYRTVAADDLFLSAATGRETATISLHHNAGLPHAEFFGDLEPVFRDHGGRPHWAKKHNLRAAELRPLYPEWDRFMALRARLDPEGVFLNPYLRELFGPA